MGITIDFDKAKEITRQRLRQERTPIFQQLDIQYQRAQEAGADTAAIVAEKNRLRDLPAQVDSCTTLDELKALRAAAD